MSLAFSPLFSGSSGNAVYVGANGVSILIDAGLSGSVVENALLGIGEDAKSIKAILITHEHVDHIKGVGILSRKYDIPIFANQATWDAMLPKIGEIREKNICVFTDPFFYIEDLLVEAIRTPHDAAMSVGYRVSYKTKSVAVMTDLGHCPGKIIAHLKDTDIVLLESNHDIGMLNSSRYPRALKKRIAGDHGHLSNEAAGEAAVALIKSGVKGILLGHLSEENNYEELAYNVVHQKLTAANIKVGRDMALGMAFRKKTAGVFHVK
jgi:phosphoribosyl 1,2-cyclic phosphodiesterase